MLQADLDQERVLHDSGLLLSLSYWILNCDADARRCDGLAERAHDAAAHAQLNEPQPPPASAFTARRRATTKAGNARWLGRRQPSFD